MLHFLRSDPWTRLGVVAILLWPAFSAAALAAPRYKAQTIVDFDAATIEGKTRRPYSSLVTQKAGQEPQYLFSWKPDWSERYKDTAASWEYLR